MTIDRWLLVATLVATVIGTVIGILSYAADMRDRRPGFRADRRGIRPGGGFLLQLHVAAPAHDRCVLKSVGVLRPQGMALAASGNVHAPLASVTFSSRAVPVIPPVTANAPASVGLILDVPAEPSEMIVLSIEWTDRTSRLRRTKVKA